RVLTVASLAGRDVPDALLHAVVGDGCAGALASIERAGLLRRVEGRHVFVHDLVRESLRDRLSVEERRAGYAELVAAADVSTDAAGLLPAQLAWMAMQAIPAVAP